jgi:hypothetical protein
MMAPQTKLWAMVARDCHLVNKLLKAGPWQSSRLSFRAANPKLRAAVVTISLSLSNFVKSGFFQLFRRTAEYDISME